MEIIDKLELKERHKIGVKSNESLLTRKQSNIVIQYTDRRQPF